MKRKTYQCLIIENKPIAKNIFQIVLVSDLVKFINSPGQFVNIKIGHQNSSFVLRRPISISKYNKQNNSFALIYKVLGNGTKELTKYKEKEYLDLLGPLGNGFNINSINKHETALLIGAGVGIPPLLELAVQLKNKGTKVITVLGFNSKEEIFYENEFKKIGSTYISTITDSNYFKGNIIELLDNLIKNNNLTFDKYYACGPLIVLKKIKEIFSNKIGYLSIENRMACGIGACYACVVKTNNQNGYSRVCKDGPVYLSSEVEM
ncbi:dihydroorotate dehydrogenase electron transfer subunit [Malacoplasma iowae]|uniref:dihydroorotate dehydrogenase electron transfer subunit n=1 Tax=Malacoplasma iowae TaxID=2116 RepID=UPI002A18BF67|nr:dihydroorotate dehydrogenase electron transfer subunit [Malacoplasma iowae]WPL40106.1 dihydroorotate dehydrogenase electron transfer subunit [Malacoplasma iowae]